MNEVWDFVPRPKDTNVNETTKFELWYTHDSIASLKSSYDIEEEYIVASSSCSRLIWVKNRLKDYVVS